jgi:peptidoglycan-associated lipoprotein
MTKPMPFSLPKAPARLALALAVVSGLLAGCESATKLNDPSTLAPVESRTPGATTAAAAGAGAAATGTPQSRVATVDLAAGGGGGAGAAGAAGSTALLAMTSQRVIYFDFDSFAIKDEFKTVVEGHAKALASYPNRKLVVEGHTDERGGREYNLALGQKRAEAVSRSLSLLGATNGQVEAVSFGKERPAVQGSDEAAWARNRRAELKDR